MPRGKDSGNDVVRQFSRIDWAGIGESFRLSSRRFLTVEKEEDKADIYDLPSLAVPNYVYTEEQSSEQKQKRGLNLQTKRVSFHEDIMEDGQHIKEALKEMQKDASNEDQGVETKRRPPWCLVITFLVTITAVVAGRFILPLIIDTSSINFEWKALRNDVLDAFTLYRQQVRGEEMLLLAEQVTAACGNLSLLSSGISRCEEFCSGYMCCVESDEETSCKNDVLCAEYVACEVLLDGNR